MRGVSAVILAVVLTGCAHAPFLTEALRGEELAQCPERPVYNGSQAEQSYDLALSGGGYRSMLFHVGAMWRLHELGLLKQVHTVSSVSGGSIAAATMARQFPRVAGEPVGATECYRLLVAAPLLKLSQTTLDLAAVTRSLFSFDSAGNVLANVYAERLFGNHRLKDLPSTPVFLFQSTNLHTGSVWTFSRVGIGDAQFGYTDAGDTLLAEAVAASSSFPPILSPFHFKSAGSWTDQPTDPSLTLGREYRARADSLVSAVPTAPALPTFVEKARMRGLLLTDGGVADNLGLEGIWESRRTVLVSDGGSPALAVEVPPTNWMSQLAHVTQLIHTQPSQLRYHLLVDGLRNRMAGKDGAYWAIAGSLPTHRERYFRCAPRADAIAVSRIAATPTRLAAIPLIRSKELVNLGYHFADWHLPYVDKLMEGGGHRISRQLPYPEAPLWSQDPGC